MLSRMNVSKKGIVLVSVPIIFELIFIAVLSFALKNAEHEAWKEAHHRAIISEANNLSGLFYQATSILISYGVVQNEASKALFYVCEDKIRERLRALSKLLAENPNPAKSLEGLNRTSNHVLQLMENTIVQFDNKNLEHAQLDKFAAVTAAKAAMVDLIGATRALVDEQTLTNRVDPKEQERARNAVRVLIVAGVILNIIIALGLALFFGKEIAARLRVILENTKRVASGQGLSPQLTGTDEIALLDKAFHDMSAAVAEANRKERAAVENALDVICSLDKEGRFLKVNPAASKQWGYSEAELLGQKIEDFLSVSESGQDQVSMVNEILMHRKTVEAFEIRFRRKDDSTLDLRCSLSWSEQDQTAFCIAHDITARKEAERFKQQLIQMVSHDLRTPLASLQHVNEMLIEGVYGQLPENAESCLRISDNNILRLIRLVNDFLDFEKMEAGKLQLRYSKVEVAQILKESLSAVSALASESGLKIDVQDSLLQLEADGDRLIQVLVNLLSNSIKFSPAESTISVKVKRTGEQVEFSIIDQGPGIPEEMRSSIFGRFKQIDSGKTKTKIKGTGLGLSICKGLVEAHHGTIGVENNQDRGSRFWFCIPLKRPADLSEN